MTVAVIMIAIGCIGSLRLFKRWVDELPAETAAEINATEQIRTFTQQDVERYIGASFPNTATDIHYRGYTVGMQDSEVFIRFSISPSDLNNFLEELEITEPLKEQFYSGELRYGYQRTIDWWEPQKAQRYSGIRTEPEQSIVLSVLVDKTQSDEYKIYVHRLKW